MRLTQACDLREQGNVVKAVRICGRRMRLAVIHRVDSCKKIARRKNLVEPRGTKILAKILHRTAVRLGNAALCPGRCEDFRAVRHRPESEQRPHTRHSGDAGGIIRHKRDVAQAEVLPVAFVVAEKECFVAANWPAERTAEDIALEVGDIGLIKEVSRVKRAVAHELICGAVQLIGPPGGHDAYLRAGPFPVFCAVGVFQHGKLANRIYSQ